MRFLREAFPDVWHVLAFLAVLAVVASLGCGPAYPPPDIVTARGVQVYTHGFAVDAGTLDEMEAYLPAECGEQLIVGFFSWSDMQALAQRDGATQPVAGEYLPGEGVARVAWLPDLWTTAYVHEAAHHTLWCTTGDADGDHTDPLWARVRERSKAVVVLP